MSIYDVNSLLTGGPEVEPYLDIISIEAVGGLVNVDFGASDKDKAFTVDGRVGEHGFTTVTIGFNIYFGGDSSKSLIRRHREDDPPIRGLDIFGGGRCV